VYVCLSVGLILGNYNQVAIANRTIEPSEFQGHGLDHDRKTTMDVYTGALERDKKETASRVAQALLAPKN
jgi:hypothetical protein